MIEFTPRQVLQRQMVVYPIIAGIVVIGLWGWWGWKAYSERAVPNTGVLESTFWLGLAALATVAVPIGVAWFLMNTRLLLSRGQMVSARVAHIGGAAANGMQSVKFEYIVNGRTYGKHMSVGTAVLNAFTPETTVPVIYDPEKPSRAQVFTHLSGVVIEEPSFASEVVGESFSYILFGGLFLAHLVGGFLLLKWLGDPYKTTLLGPAVFAVLAVVLLEQRLIEQWRGQGGAADVANRRWRDRWMILFAVVAIGWGAYAVKAGGTTEQDIVNHEEQSARVRAERAKIERDSREAIERMKAIQEQRKK